MSSVSETSPVEAGEVARIACRRGGDLPRGFHCVQNDTFLTRHCEWNEAIPKIGVRMTIQAAPPFIAG